MFNFPFSFLHPDSGLVVGRLCRKPVASSCAVLNRLFLELKQIAGLSLNNKFSFPLDFLFNFSFHRAVFSVQNGPKASLFPLGYPAA